MKKFFALFAAVLFAGSMVMAEELKATLDFSSNEVWNIPSDAKAIDAASFSDGTYTITLQGTEGNGYRWYNNGSYLLIGKQGATLTLPAFEWNTTKIVVTGREGASAATIQNIFVGDNAVSTQTTGAQGENTYLIAPEYQAAGNVYVLKVVSNHNTQITKIEIYGGEGGDPLPAVVDYYLVGTMNEWARVEDFKFAANPANEGEFMLKKVVLPANSEMKVQSFDGDTAIWFPEGVDNNFVINDSNMYNIFFRPDGQGGEGWHEGFIFAEVYQAPVINSCASAVAALQAGEVDPEATYTIEAYVTEIATAYSEQYHNITFWMADAVDGGKVLEAFRAACESEEAAPKVGDKVRVAGKLTMYGTTPEFAAACTFEIIEHAAPVVNYYLVGTMNEWARVEAFMFAANPANEGEFMLKNVVIPANSEMKVQGFDGENETWFPAGGEDKNFVINDSNAYNIFFRPDGQGGEGWHEGFIFAEVYVAPEINSCASAAEAALSVSENNELYNNGAVYTIEGFVTNIATAYSDQYHNITFWMADSLNGGKVLEAFRAACESEEAAPRVGDKVAVTGSLTKYNTTPEFAAGCTFEIIERGEIVPVDPQNLGAKTIAEFLELKNEVDTCILTGTVSNIVNTTYGNFDLTDETATVFVYGLLTPDGQSKQFENMGIVEGDVITVLALYNEYQGTPQVKNAILVSKAEGVNNVAAETKAVKMMVNGQLVIEKNGVRYNAVGQVVE